MNPYKEREEDGDPVGGAESKGKKTQKSRNSLEQNNNDRSPPDNYYRNNAQQEEHQQQQQQQEHQHQQQQQEQQQQPQRHQHPYNGNHSGSIQPPLPHWQYFTRHRPFGESPQHYQFPPPVFSQQFRFGTFPGRSSPRLRHHHHHRRENVETTGANNIRPEAHLHSHQDIPNNAAARPKTKPFLNGKKKSSKSNKYLHDSSKSNKASEDIRINESSLDCDTAEDSNFVYNISGSMKEKFFSVEDDRMKVSKSCDGGWVNGITSEDSSVLTRENSEMPLAEEGAVGGVPVTVDNTVGPRDVASVQLEKDLIDEGAIFDLDNIFQNHEISRKSDNYFTNGSESEDDLDFVFDFDSTNCVETILSDAESDNLYFDRELYNNAGHLSASASLVNGSKRDYHSPRTMQNSAGYVSNGIINGIIYHNIGCSDNSSNSNNNERNDFEDSDGGEDTGDFIDTDLPSHVKHILSSSDEMDNQSSSKESDDEDSTENRRRPSENAVAKKEKSYSDYNSNDISISTLEPHLLNSLSHLSMKTMQSKERGIKALSSQQDSIDNGTHCNLKEKSLSTVSVNAENNSEHTSQCSCEYSESDTRKARSSVSPSYVRTDSNSSHLSTMYGAAADVDISSPTTENLSCILDHPGADCELPSSSLDQCGDHNSQSVNVRMRSSVNSQSQHNNNKQCLLEHSELSASSGHCPHPSNLPSQSNSNASGTSPAEEGNSIACCSHSQRGVNNLNSVCHCHNNHNHHGHVADGFSDEGEGIRSFIAGDDENRHRPKCSSLAGQMADGATVSASAADRELDMNSDLSKQNTPNVDCSMGGGSEDPLNFESNGDHVDMVLLPMEEEIEPVHIIDNTNVFGPPDSDEESLMYNALSCCSSLPPPAAVNAHHHHHHRHRRHPKAGSSRSYEECHGARIMDPVSFGKRLPSKEFYELIKTVSSTDSYMRFFDKNGEDVQRSTPKTSNDEDSSAGSTNPTKGGKHGRKITARGEGTGLMKVDRVMIWNEYEAYVVQYKQIAVSACGQTAVLNVLKALKFQCEKSTVCKVIKTNLRKDDKDIPEYLFSRACAGTTAVELMSGIEKLSGGVIGGRFFHFWPPRKVKLLQWLAYWMKRGAIPMATLNLQQGPHSVWEVPDSWHHQMVYGVSYQGLYLTNPLEIVSERSAIKQLHSDSVLLVRRQDIVSRFKESTDLGQLLDHPDPRWMTANVLGQVVNVLRECNMPSVPGYRLQVTSHVRIPASYQAGITLFMRKDQPAWNTLVTSSELPLQ